MEDAYVTFGTAKRLKEKGFDWVVDTYYCDDYDYAQHDIIEYRKENYNSHKAHISAPTQQMACSWLRKEKGIHILPEISEVKENPKYYCMIWKISTLESFIVDLFGSYEDAVEAALQYCLTNLV